VAQEPERIIGVASYISLLLTSFLVLSYTVDAPTQKLVMQVLMQQQEPIDVDGLASARTIVKTTIATQLRRELQDVYRTSTGEWAPSAAVVVIVVVVIVELVVLVVEVVVSGLQVQQ
jgi:hypothetical protein